MGLEQSRINMRKQRAQSTNSPPPPKLKKEPKASAKGEIQSNPSTFGDACKILGITSSSEDSFSNGEDERHKKQFRNSQPAPVRPLHLHSPEPALRKNSGKKSAPPPHRASLKLETAKLNLDLDRIRTLVGTPPPNLAQKIPRRHSFGIVQSNSITTNHVRNMSKFILSPMIEKRRASNTSRREPVIPPLRLPAEKRDLARMPEMIKARSGGKMLLPKWRTGNDILSKAFMTEYRERGRFLSDLGTNHYGKQRVFNVAFKQ